MCIVLLCNQTFAALTIAGLTKGVRGSFFCLHCFCPKRHQQKFDFSGSVCFHDNEVRHCDCAHDKRRSEHDAIDDKTGQMQPPVFPFIARKRYIVDILHLLLRYGVEYYIVNLVCSTYDSMERRVIERLDDLGPKESFVQLYVTAVRDCKYDAVYLAAHPSRRANCKNFHIWHPDQSKSKKEWQATSLDAKQKLLVLRMLDWKAVLIDPKYSQFVELMNHLYKDLADLYDWLEVCCLHFCFVIFEIFRSLMIRICADRKS